MRNLKSLLKIRSTRNRIVGVSINEDLSSGLLKDQFVFPMKYAARYIDVVIINVCQPHLIYRDKDIRIINLPIAAPARFWVFNRLLFFIPVFSFFTGTLIRLLLRSGDTMVARGYLSGVVCSSIRSKNPRYKLFFDPRSLFIEERVFSGKIKKGSYVYSKWKSEEAKIISNSDKVFTVSRAQADVYFNIGLDKNKVVFLPCLSTFVGMNKVDPSDLRRDLGYEEKDIVVVYYGSMDNGWNNVNLYRRIFSECIDYGYKILVLSQDYEKLRSYFSGESSILIVDTQGMKKEKILEYMRVADYGIVVMPKLEDWESRLSVKYVEYLGAGLKVIVGEYVGEAVFYSNKYFSDRTRIYKNKNSLKGLTRREEYPDNIVKDLFSVSNFLSALGVLVQTRSDTQ